MNKRRILAIAMSLCIVAILAVGASLAYFTDTKSATNTFTTGKVKITLNEEFDADNAKLLPGSQSKNAVQKEVSITLNEGSEDSWVWYEWLIPAALDSKDGSTGTNNIVHVNSLGRTWDKYRENSKYWAKDQTEALPESQTWDHDPEEVLTNLLGPEGYIGQETIDGIVYNKYATLYHGMLKAGETTSVGMSQVYMDAGVNTNDAGQYVDKNGDVINYDFSKDIKIIVRAYGMQAAGFNTVYEAYAAFNNK